MKRLVVHALAMRQLGRLNPHHIIATGYGPWQTEWCPRAIHVRQLWGCAAIPALGSHRPAPCGRDSAGAWPLHHLRFKSNKKKGSAKTTSEEDEEDDEVHPEDSDYEDDADENSNLPKDYKDVEKNVQSFRYDVIMKAGLDLARNKIEDAFYDNKLRLNGQRLIKKSKTVKVGDTLDLVLSENRENNTVALMRVAPRRVFGETTSTEKYRVVLRRWKYIELPKDEAFKS
ncbi:mitochondrial transcription rescue factor 1 isoform X3 [Takifugu rubripes]|nr:uncharacterized protein C6orf203 homolog isoform X3 [Takifugu rubripes]|eukprot:XP_011612756.1 PREDICTED: uncharacterized protein C6orf203 homolog isoform X3 [Takifugu rubripes]